MARQVGHRHEGPLEHRHQQQILAGVVGGDLGAHLGEAVLRSALRKSAPCPVFTPPPRPRSAPVAARRAAAPAAACGPRSPRPFSHLLDHRPTRPQPGRHTGLTQRSATGLEPAPMVDRSPGRASHHQSPARPAAPASRRRPGAIPAVLEAPAAIESQGQTRCPAHRGRVGARPARQAPGRVPHAGPSRRAVRRPRLPARGSGGHAATPTSAEPGMGSVIEQGPPHHPGRPRLGQGQRGGREAAGRLTSSPRRSGTSAARPAEDGIVGGGESRRCGAGRAPSAG